MQYQYLLACLLLFSAGIFTLTEPVKAQNNNRVQRSRSVRDPSFYMQAFNMANERIYGCISESRLEDCEKLNQMENTLIRWCSQNDKMACQLFMHIQATRHLEEIGKLYSH